MEILRTFALFLGQMDFGAGLLFGLPLLVIGLTLAGLARGDRARWLVARALRRHVAEIDAPGPVTLTGTVRRTGTLALEEGAARAALEVAPELVLMDGEVVTVYGEARSVGPVAAGYRDDARAFVIDLRSDEHFGLRGRANLDALVRNARIQRAGGSIVDRPVEPRDPRRRHRGRAQPLHARGGVAPQPLGGAEPLSARR